MADIEVPHPGAFQIVGRLLSDALRDHPDVQWLGLVSEDGFAIASEGSLGIDNDEVAAAAVRMMVQVRGMSKALGQVSTSQMLLEGSENGICVIDKDPWVLVVVGAEGVPIGLLRYEAREIAETFPMGRRAQLPAASLDDDSEDLPVTADWAELATGSFPAGQFDDRASLVPDLDFGPESADESIVIQPDVEPEIRWADEPAASAAPGGLVVDDLTADVAPDIFAQTGPELVEELEMPSVGVEDFSDWGIAQPGVVDEPMFDLPAPDEVVPMAFEMPATGTPTGQASDEFAVPSTLDPSVFDLPAPSGLEQSGGFDDLSDLAPPAGPVFELPPPAGPAFDLPPPG
ncbi:MAG TPA: roadblock/LC7 domain-containing protein [Actinomycetota bacterium]|nr:roadblock/LC7 domain-containing protein [Actinomycetota bacterium]